MKVNPLLDSLFVLGMEQRYEVHDGPTLAGFATVSPYRRFPDTHSVITRIRIRNDYQGQGYGSKLMNQITRDADGQGKHLVLVPEADDPDRQRDLLYFYRIHGFTGGNMPGAMMIRRPNIPQQRRPSEDS